jgi:hypothetical protein
MLIFGARSSQGEKGIKSTCLDYNLIQVLAVDVVTKNKIIDVISTFLGR